jgi:hypothetical protein
MSEIVIVTSFFRSLEVYWCSACAVLLEKPPFVPLLKNFPQFYGTLRFITAFTRDLHWSVSWDRRIQSTQPQLISLRYVLILSTDLIIVFLAVSFLLLSHHYIICIPLLFHSCYIPCPSHSPRHYHSNHIRRRLQVKDLLIMQFSPTSCHFISPRSWKTRGSVLNGSKHFPNSVSY